MAASNIEWTDATWNPTVGCTKKSPGCKNCYAETMHARLTAMGQRKYAQPFRVVQPWEDDLGAPLHWKKPRRVFVNSMSDLFHESLSNEYIAAVFAVMAVAHQHTFQILTKRSERLPEWYAWMAVDPAQRAFDALMKFGHFNEDFVFFVANYINGQACWRKQREDGKACDGRVVWPLPNAWIGVSIENQDYADRMLDLVSVPAAVRFLSCEPLIGPLALGLLGTLPKDLGLGYRGFYDFIHWVIVGGESGHGARPCALEWIERIVDECREVEVPVFVKQLGACVVSEERTAPVETMAALCGASAKDYDGYRAPSGEVWAWRAGLSNKKGGDPAEWPDELRVRQWPEVQS